VVGVTSDRVGEDAVVPGFVDPQALHTAITAAVSPAAVDKRCVGRITPKSTRSTLTPGRPRAGARNDTPQRQGNYDSL
jgi:hypothetical protein